MDLTARLAAQIVEYIRYGQVPPGTRLVERTLADQLRVSRSPVRSALRALHSKGIVGIAEGGGYVCRAALYRVILRWGGRPPGGIDVPECGS